jgi:DNA ligase-1
MKQDLADSVDAVILGYYYGTGVRSKFGIGAILIGVYDDQDDRYISLAKVGTGFKDEDFIKIKKELDAIKIEKLPANVIINKNLVPDVIVNPEIVCVVEADSISLSNVHGADKDDSGAIVQGLSLRFPRIKQFGRDKKPEQATTVKELKRMYILAKN